MSFVFRLHPNGEDDFDYEDEHIELESDKKEYGENDEFEEAEGHLKPEPVPVQSATQRSAAQRLQPAEIPELPVKATSEAMLLAEVREQNRKAEAETAPDQEFAAARSIGKSVKAARPSSPSKKSPIKRAAAAAAPPTTAAGKKAAKTSPSGKKTAKKSAQKASPAKASAKKAVPGKTVPKKTAVRKATAKKAASKKAPIRKTPTKKAAKKRK